MMLAGLAIKLVFDAFKNRNFDGYVGVFKEIEKRAGEKLN